MIKGKSFKLFVISTIITHKETVIRIEPPRKEAAPNSAYLEIHQEAYRTLQKQMKNPTSLHCMDEGKGHSWSKTY